LHARPRNPARAGQSTKPFAECDRDYIYTMKRLNQFLSAILFLFFEFL